VIGRAAVQQAANAIAGEFDAKPCKNTLVSPRGDNFL